MTPVNVLVVFCSRYGEAERLALAAGLGAIQQKANIRLRRLADDASQESIAASPAWQQELERMNRDYVTPRPADAVWAHAIVFATSAHSWSEIEGYLSVMPADGSMAGKLAAVLTPGQEPSRLRPLYAAAAMTGLTVVPPASSSADAVTDARLYGQRVVQMVRALAGAMPGEQ